LELKIEKKRMGSSTLEPSTLRKGGKKKKKKKNHQLKRDEEEPATTGGGGGASGLLEKSPWTIRFVSALEAKTFATYGEGGNEES